jgi:hypothetical protein
MVRAKRSLRLEIAADGRGTTCDGAFRAYGVRTIESSVGRVLKSGAYKLRIILGRDQVADRD